MGAIRIVTGFTSGQRITPGKLPGMSSKPGSLGSSGGGPDGRGADAVVPLGGTGGGVEEGPPGPVRIGGKAGACDPAESPPSPKPVPKPWNPVASIVRPAASSIVRKTAKMARGIVGGFDDSHAPAEIANTVSSAALMVSSVPARKWWRNITAVTPNCSAHATESAGPRFRVSMGGGSSPRSITGSGSHGESTASEAGLKVRHWL